MSASAAPSRWARFVVTAPIRLYRVALSPWLPPRCRYWPSCSAYAVEAIERHGVGRGGWLAVKRLASCHPWRPGGFDPVPNLETEPAAGGGAP